MIGRVNKSRRECVCRVTPNIKECGTKGVTLKKLEKDYVKSVIRLRELYQETRNPTVLDPRVLFDVCMEFHKVSTLFQLMEIERSTLRMEEDEKDF